MNDAATHERLVQLLEAMLYASDAPVPTADLVHLLQKVGAAENEPWVAEVDADAIQKASVALDERLQEAGSALQVIEVAGGLRLGTRPRYDAWIRALREVERPSRLSVAALETLAVVAYRQPTTLAEIASVRGVDPSTSLGTLRELGLIRITGRKRAVGRPFTYGTTKHFLELFGLRDLDELPDPEEFEELLEG